MKTQRNTAQIKEQTRNKEVQMKRKQENYLKKIQNNDSKDDQKP